MLAVDMHAAGVEVRPLVQLTGEAEFNEVVLHEVFVPADQLVGPEGEGWRVAGSTLAHERGVNPRQLVIHGQLVDELLRLAERTGAFGDRRKRQALAEAYTEVRLFQLHNWRSLPAWPRGEEPGPRGQRPQAVLERDVQAPPRRRPWTSWARRPRCGGAPRATRRRALAAPGSTTRRPSIFAGTNEIQRNVVGERVLGLPRVTTRATPPHRAGPAPGCRNEGGGPHELRDGPLRGPRGPWPR